MNERMMNDEKCILNCLYHDITNLCFVSLSDIYLFYFKSIHNLVLYENWSHRNNYTDIIENFIYSLKPGLKKYFGDQVCGILFWTCSPLYSIYCKYLFLTLQVNCHVYGVP